MTLQNIQQPKNAKLKNITVEMQEFVEQIEGEFNCSGVCTPGPFFWFAKLDQGPPEQNCIEGIRAAFRSKPLAVGVVLLVTFVLTFATFITQFSICCHKGSKKGKHEY